MEFERRVPRRRIGNRREQQCHERDDDLQVGRQVGCPTAHRSGDVGSPPQSQTNQSCREPRPALALADNRANYRQYRGPDALDPRFIRSAYDLSLGLAIETTNVQRTAAPRKPSLLQPLQSRPCRPSSPIPGAMTCESFRIGKAARRPRSQPAAVDRHTTSYCVHAFAPSHQFEVAAEREKSRQSGGSRSNTVVYLH